MSGKQTEERLRRAEAELELLRARSDVLALVLKQVIIGSPQPYALFESVMRSLDMSDVGMLYSAAPTDVYVRGFSIAVDAVARWRASLPPDVP